MRTYNPGLINICSFCRNPFAVFERRRPPEQCHRCQNEIHELTTRCVARALSEGDIAVEVRALADRLRKRQPMTDREREDRRRELHRDRQARYRQRKSA